MGIPRRKSIGRLLSGVALCAKVAAKKMPMDEAAQRLGVRIIRADQKKPAHLKIKTSIVGCSQFSTAFVSAPVACACYQDPRQVDTLARHGRSGTKRHPSCGAKNSATPSVGGHSSETKLQYTSPVSTFRNNARGLIFSIIFFPLAHLSFLGIACIYAQEIQQTETFARGASRSARKCKGRGMIDAAYSMDEAARRVPCCPAGCRTF